MKHAKDDWEKPRTHGQHLTAEEIAQIKQGFLTGRSARSVAQQLKCASRNVSKYYTLFRAQDEVAFAPIMRHEVILAGRPSPQLLAEREERERAKDLRDLTAVFCGDPPPGYSMLDRR